MDIVSPEKMDIVCKGCLCQDENLTSEQSDLVKKLYHDIMNLPIAVETFDTLKLRLCVECTTNILNYDAFKKQCHIAHEILNKHFAMESTLQVLEDEYNLYENRNGLTAAVFSRVLMVIQNGRPYRSRPRLPYPFVFPEYFD